ncbi:hypothetical protein EJ08DRAFT_649430 [Tothia fuscella]|uniref:Uncharacterized protein n=1 Tax=Tothia fuscella TaxID=1048955 RepID=A0A9P4TZ75_9PEZI|nr:hypothetical protein EJ08DRAFT_649430 [Tothia fuscella]
MVEQDLENQPVTGLVQPRIPVEEEAHGNPPARSSLPVKERVKERILRALSIRINVKLEPEDGYTTYSFNSLSKPLAVEDPFLGSRVLIASRLIFRGLVLIWAFQGLLSAVTLEGFGVLIWLLTPIAFMLGRKKIYQIRGVAVPTLKNLWSFYKYPQWFWEKVGTRILLRSRTSRIWWIVYLLISDLNEFEQNFLNAWMLQDVHITASDATAQSADEEESNAGVRVNTEIGCRSLRPRTPVLIYVHEEPLEIPILFQDISNTELLKQLKMFYRYLKIKRGLAELVIPRKLMKIDCVEVDPNTDTPGTALDSLKCGRNMVTFYNPTKATKRSRKLAEHVELLRGGNRYQALEFVRGLNRAAMGGIILMPPLLSLIFITIWLSVFLHKKDGKLPAGVNLHNVIESGFAIASFMVTAGGFIIALTAFLETKETEKDKGKELSTKGRMVSGEDNGPSGEVGQGRYDAWGAGSSGSYNNFDNDHSYSRGLGKAPRSIRKRFSSIKIFRRYSSDGYGSDSRGHPHNGRQIPRASPANDRITKGKGRAGAGPSPSPLAGMMNTLKHKIAGASIDRRKSDLHLAGKSDGPMDRPHTRPTIGCENETLPSGFGKTSVDVEKPRKTYHPTSANGYYLISANGAAPSGKPRQTTIRELVQPTTPFSQPTIGHTQLSDLSTTPEPKIGASVPTEARSRERVIAKPDEKHGKFTHQRSRSENGDTRNRMTHEKLAHGRRKSADCILVRPITDKAIPCFQGIDIPTATTTIPPASTNTSLSSINNVTSQPPARTMGASSPAQVVGEKPASTN